MPIMRPRITPTVIPTASVPMSIPALAAQTFMPELLASVSTNMPFIQIKILCNIIQVIELCQLDNYTVHISCMQCTCVIKMICNSTLLLLLYIYIYIYIYIYNIYIYIYIYICMSLFTYIIYKTFVFVVTASYFTGRLYFNLDEINKTKLNCIT